MAEPAKEKLIPSDPPHLSPGLPSGPSSHHSVAPLSPEIGNPKALAAPSTQKSLSKAQVAGIKAVEHILLKNNGGMFSGSTVPPAPPLRAPTIPPLGPASNTRSITKSSSIPLMGFAPQGSTTPTAIGNPNLTPPPTTWKNLYGLTLPLQSRSQSPTRGRSQSRSHSTPSPTESRACDQSHSAKADSEVMGRLDDLENKHDVDHDALDAWITILEGHHRSANDGMTVTDLQESAVKRFNSVAKDLQFLDGERTAHVKGLAAISKRADVLEKVNLNLQQENATLRDDPKALLVRIARLELAPPLPLGARPVSPQRPAASPVAQPPQRRQSPPAHRTQHCTQSHDRSLSPPPESKRARTAATLPKGFLSFGPVPESAETDVTIHTLSENPRANPSSSGTSELIHIRSFAVRLGAVTGTTWTQLGPPLDLPTLRHRPGPAGDFYNPDWFCHSGNTYVEH
ncbi:hypothetical protein B0H14DRAFT_2570172 [Mycena olivaceomarginata]|nr:hypothetical protein B0H14DRAFT_2570172 [Mycena olivaceomarginata]